MALGANLFLAKIINRPSAGRQATTKRAADGAINNHHCLSVGFFGIDGGCEHYLPFYQPHPDDFIPYANHQQIRLIASSVAQPPPIRLVQLHPNTMGDAANVRFCQNHWWGRVSGGVLPMLLKALFLHATMNWDAADCIACGAVILNTL